MENNGGMVSECCNPQSFFTGYNKRPQEGLKAQFCCAFAEVARLGVIWLFVFGPFFNLLNASTCSGADAPIFVFGLLHGFKFFLNQHKHIFGDSSSFNLRSIRNHSEFLKYDFCRESLHLL